MKWNNTQYLHSSYLININLRTKDSFHFRILTTNDWSCSMIHGAFVLSRLIRENVIYKSTTDTLFLSLSLSLSFLSSITLIMIRLNFGIFSGHFQPLFPIRCCLMISSFLSRYKFTYRKITIYFSLPSMWCLSFCWILGP